MSELKELERRIETLERGMRKIRAVLSFKESKKFKYVTAKQWVKNLCITPECNQVTYAKIYHKLRPNVKYSFCRECYNRRHPGFAGNLWVVETQG